MVSIGELARQTGTTPRMLRHWEATGLLPPADVDPATGRRSYDLAQEGRVLTIVALRANGFGLEEIRVLLDSRTDHAKLRAVLDARRSTLSASIARDNAALRRLDSRIPSLDRGHHDIATTLTLEALPPLTGPGLRTSVAHESEIPAAVRAVLDRMAAPAGAEVALVYDGTTDPRVIAVTAVCEAARTDVITIPGAPRAASVRLAQRPVDLGDTWAALDAALLPLGLAATGPYRHILHSEGTATTLATPTTPVTGSV